MARRWNTAKNDLVGPSKLPPLLRKHHILPNNTGGKKKHKQKWTLESTADLLRETQPHPALLV